MLRSCCVESLVATGKALELLSLSCVRLPSSPVRATLLAMRHMVIRTPMQTGYASIRHVAVSLPYVADLVDGVKYMEPKDVPALEGTELRRSKAPSLRFIVKQALQCQSAEELGKRIRRSYQRRQAGQTTSSRDGVSNARQNRGRARSYPRRTVRRATSRPPHGHRQRHH